MQFPASSALLPFPPCQSSAHSEWQELEETNVHDPPRLPRRIHFATFRPFLSLYFAERSLAGAGKSDKSATDESPL